MGEAGNARNWLMDGQRDLAEPYLHAAELGNRWKRGHSEPLFTGRKENGVLGFVLGFWGGVRGAFLLTRKLPARFVAVVAQIAEQGLNLSGS